MLLAAAASPDSVPAIGQLFGWVAGGLGVLVGVPQAWRLWVGRRHEGLSLSSNVLGVIFTTGWFLYGVASQAIVLIVTALLALGVGTVVLAGHVRVGRAPVGSWLPGLAAGLAVVFGLFLLGRVPLGLAASAATISGVLPQAVTLVRRRRAGLFDVSGISQARWVLSSACNGLWIVYGLSSANALIIGNSTVIALLCVAIIVITRGSAQRAAEPADWLPQYAAVA